MMAKTRRIFTDAQKNKVAAEALSQGYGHAKETARKYGLHDSLIYRWIKEGYGQNGTKPKTQSKKSDSDFLMIVQLTFPKGIPTADRAQLDNDLRWIWELEEKMENR